MIPRLWLRQILAVVRLEIGKNLFVLRSMPLYLLALLPVMVVLLLIFVKLAFNEGPPELESAGGTAMFFAIIYQFILRFVIYLGCVWIFMNLFRGEVLDRSLHFYFLTPIRRDVLVVGKFVSGWVAACLLFATSTLVSLFLIYAYSGVSQAVSQLLSGAGLKQLIGYAATTALACLGYGAVFLVMGLFLRNPIVPALIIWLWELANPFLPVLLKKISVIFYIQSVLPVRVSEGPLAIIANPTPVWLAVPGLLLFSAMTLVAAGLRIRSMEIAYGSD